MDYSVYNLFGLDHKSTPDFKIGDRIIVISGKHTHKTKRRTITKVTDTRVYFGTHWALKKDVIK